VNGRSRYNDWRSKHYGKRVYPSRGRAWLAILRIWLQERRRPDSLQPYACRYTARADAGPSGKPHVHIGHGRYTPQARANRWLRLAFVYPFFRARRQVRLRLRALMKPTRMPVNC